MQIQRRSSALTDWVQEADNFVLPLDNTLEVDGEFRVCWKRIKLEYNNSPSDAYLNVDLIINQ